MRSRHRQRTDVPLRGFGQLGDVLGFKAKEFEVKNLGHGLRWQVLFKRKVPVDLLTHGFYEMYEQTEEMENGITTTENVRMRSRLMRQQKPLKLTRGPQLRPSVHVIIYIFTASAPHTDHRTSGLVAKVWNNTLEVLYVRTRTLWGAVDAYKGIGAKVLRALDWRRTTHQWGLFSQTCKDPPPSACVLQWSAPGGRCACCRPGFPPWNICSKKPNCAATMRQNKRIANRARCLDMP